MLLVSHNSIYFPAAFWMKLFLDETAMCGAVDSIQNFFIAAMKNILILVAFFASNFAHFQGVSINPKRGHLMM